MSVTEPIYSIASRTTSAGSTTLGNAVRLSNLSPGPLGFVGDLDGDGRPDISVSDTIHWGDAGGTFETSTGMMYFSDAGDFDADGDLDLLVNQNNTSHIAFADGMRTFARTRAIPVSAQVMDINKDGAADLIDTRYVLPYEPNRFYVVSIYLSTAKTTPAGPPDIRCGPVPLADCTGPTSF